MNQLQFHLLCLFLIQKSLLLRLLLQKRYLVPVLKTELPLRFLLFLLTELQFLHGRVKSALLMERLLIHLISVNILQVKLYGTVFLLTEQLQTKVSIALFLQETTLQETLVKASLQNL